MALFSTTTSTLLSAPESASGTLGDRRPQPRLAIKESGLYKLIARAADDVVNIRTATIDGEPWFVASESAAPSACPPRTA